MIIVSDGSGPSKADQVLEPDGREGLVEDDVLVTQLAKGVDPVGRHHEQRAGPDLGLLVTDPGPQSALLDEHDLLGLVMVVGDHHAAAIDDPGEHRLLARDGLPEDARDVLDGGKVVPFGDLAHSRSPAQLACVFESSALRISSGVTGSSSMRTPMAS